MRDGHSTPQSVAEVRIYRCADCKRIFTVYVPGYGWIGSGSHLACPARRVAA